MRTLVNRVCDEVLDKGLLVEYFLRLNLLFYALSSYIAYLLHILRHSYTLMNSTCSSFWNQQMVFRTLYRSLKSSY